MSMVAAIAALVLVLLVALGAWRWLRWRREKPLRERARQMVADDEARLAVTSDPAKRRKLQERIRKNRRV